MIAEVMVSIDKKMVANACRQFRSQVERGGEVKGGFIYWT